jgi:hypothetical protein
VKLEEVPDLGESFEFDSTCGQPSCRSNTLLHWATVGYKTPDLHTVRPLISWKQIQVLFWWIVSLLLLLLLIEKNYFEFLVLDFIVSFNLLFLLLIVVLCIVR